MREIVLIAHNVRSCHNVGSLLRTAEGLGVQKVFLTGYTPFPAHPNDDRLPHLAAKIDKQISKTSLGAEQTIDWEHKEDVGEVLRSLDAEGYLITALEQTATSQPLHEFTPPQKVALIVGREVEGIEAEILQMAPVHLEIPMSGSKESFNVANAASMALYHLRFTG